MKLTKQNNALRNLLYILGGLGGISLIITVHETGHFLFAKLFGVPTPSFLLALVQPSMLCQLAKQFLN